MELSDPRENQLTKKKYKHTSPVYTWTKKRIIKERKQSICKNIHIRFTAISKI